MYLMLNKSTITDKKPILIKAM